MLLNIEMTEKQHRPPLTSEEAQEKIRLKDKYTRAKKWWPEKHLGEKLTDNKIGELVADAIGRDKPFSQGAVWQFMSTKSDTRPPEEFVIGISYVLGFDVNEIDPKYGKVLNLYERTIAKNRPESNARIDAGVDEWDEGTPVNGHEVELPYYSDVILSAGDGLYCDNEIADKKLRFSKQTLKSAGVQAAHAICAKVSGSSMSPVLPDGSTVGIDTSQKTIIDGSMYAINHKKILRIKLLYKLPGGGLRLRSYNRDEFPDEPYEDIEEAEIHVIGKVFWYSVMC